MNSGLCFGEIPVKQQVAVGIADRGFHVLQPDFHSNPKTAPGSATPGGEGRMISQFSYNTPDADSDIKPRTLGLPGEQYGHPSNDTYNTVSRRTMTATPDPRVHRTLRRMAREAIAAADVEYPEWYFVPRLNNLSTMPDYGHSDAALPRGKEGEEIVVSEDGDGTTKTAYKRRWQKGRRQRKSRWGRRWKRRRRRFRRAG